MRIRRIGAILVRVALGAGALTTTALGAQQTDSMPLPRASFAGRITSTRDGSPVRSAELRLFFIDSTQVRARRGSDSLEIFVDTLKSRIGVTDTAGKFAVRRLGAGHYLLEIRRIGFQPLQGALTVDTGLVEGNFSMDVTSQLLSKVIITESRVDRVKERLDRVGFLERSHLGTSGTFIDRKEILRQKPQTVADILSRYGIHEGEFMLDRMPADFELMRDYPADMVIGIEIYRHNRPVEFGGTRRGPGMMSPGGLRSSMAPTVLIWTYIP